MTRIVHYKKISCPLSKSLHKRFQSRLTRVTKRQENLQQCRFLCVTLTVWEKSSPYTMSYKRDTSTSSPSPRESILIPASSHNLLRKKCSSSASSTASTSMTASTNFLKTGLPTQNLRMGNQTPHSTISAFMHPNPFPCGRKMDGSIATIRADGFSGTAATTWDAGFRKKTNGR